MKQLFIILGVLALSACGKDEQKDPNVQRDPQTYEGACLRSAAMGRWVGTYGDLYLNGDCTGYDVRCDARFTWTDPQGYQQTIVSIWHSNSQPGCMPTGTYTCMLSPGHRNLQFSCGFGSWNYVRAGAQ